MDLRLIRIEFSHNSHISVFVNNWEHIFCWPLLYAVLVVLVFRDKFILYTWCLGCLVRLVGELVPDSS